MDRTIELKGASRGERADLLCIVAAELNVNLGSARLDSRLGRPIHPRAVLNNVRHSNRIDQSNGFPFLNGDRGHLEVRGVHLHRVPLTGTARR